MKKKYSKYKKNVYEELHKSFAEEKTPRQIAGSFAIGVFITALPTLGTGFILFFILAKAFSWVSKIALISSVFVMNPLIKPFVYVASINLGGIILTGSFTATTNPEDLLKFLIAGNTVIASVLSVIAYFFAYEAVVKYRETGINIVEEINEEIESEIKEIEEQKIS